MMVDWDTFVVGMIACAIVLGCVVAIFDIRRDHQAMLVIDARSGREMHVGDTVRYPGGESVTLLEAKPGLLKAMAKLRMVHLDYADPELEIAPRYVTREDWVPLQVRWTHPSYFGKWVGFIPS
jgi:hypothetical protein